MATYRKVIGSDGALLGLVNPSALKARVGDDDDWFYDPQYYPGIFEAGEAVLWNTDGDGGFEVLVTDDPSQFAGLPLDAPVEYLFQSTGRAFLDGGFEMTRGTSERSADRWIELPPGALRIRLGQVMGFAPVEAPHYVLWYEAAPGGWRPPPLYGIPQLREFTHFVKAPEGAPATYPDRDFFDRGATLTASGPHLALGPSALVDELAQATDESAWAEYLRDGRIAAFDLPGREEVFVVCTSNPLQLQGLRLGTPVELPMLGDRELRMAWGTDGRRLEGPAGNWRVRVSNVLNQDEPSRYDRKPEVVIFLDSYPAGQLPTFHERPPALPLP